jgi:hypothetical protein
LKLPRFLGKNCNCLRRLAKVAERDKINKNLGKNGLLARISGSPHNLEVAGSNPVPAIYITPESPGAAAGVFCMTIPEHFR